MTSVSGGSPLLPWDRRAFLRAGGLAIAGYPLAASLSPLRAGSQPSQARTCILIYLLGGPPHLDMWDLKPDAPAEIRGPFKPVPTGLPGLQICEHLPRLAQLAKRFALVRSVSHNNHNHTPMIYYTLTGREVEQPGMDNDVRPPQRTDAPHVGALVARYRPSRQGLPGYIAIPEVAVRSSMQGEFKRARTPLRGGGAGFLGPLVEPLCVNGEPGTAEGAPVLTSPKDVNAERLDRRASLLSLLEGKSLPERQAHRAFRQQAIALSGANGSGADVFTLNAEPPRMRDRYGDHRFGKALLLARRLAEVETPLVAIHFNEMTICDGWDTHAKNFEALQGELLPMLDQGLSALIEDLEQRGLLEQTLVLVMGEFGRTPKINKDAGRDHWGSCQSVLLAGGRIRGGRVLGASDRIGAYPSSDPIDPVDVHATMFQCLGLDPAQIIHDHLQRPYPLSTGRVLSELL